MSGIVLSYTQLLYNHPIPDFLNVYLANVVVSSSVLSADLQTAGRERRREGQGDLVPHPAGAVLVNNQVPVPADRPDQPGSTRHHTTTETVLYTQSTKTVMYFKLSTDNSTTSTDIYLSILDRQISQILSQSDALYFVPTSCL